MRLTPHEIDKLLLSQCGYRALQRLSRGVRLNIPESIALISMVVLELARDGFLSVAQLMSSGRQLLGRNQVIPGVEAVVDQVQVEATFPDGTKLVTIHNPIALENANLELTFRGSSLPLPLAAAFSAHHPEQGLVPGEVISLVGHVHINKGRSIEVIEVFNTCDRPIQVGSHYHFTETNKRLQFDRRIAYGKRLNIAAGTSVRFEPGERKLVSLIPIAGNKIIRGGNGLCNGPVNNSATAMNALVHTLQEKGFLHVDDNNVSQRTKKQKTDESGDLLDGKRVLRTDYNAMYGPTTGDIVRLADTSLYIRVEKDLTVYGDECKFGGGKTIREGMGQATGFATWAQLDTVITNALIVDYSGIFKADIGIKDGNICGIGKAGNPDVMEGVASSLIVGVNTEVIAGKGLIITAGGMDSHIHFICPQICDVAISAGLTTLLGGGTGPASGTTATTCTPGPFHMKMMLQSTDDIPLNFGFTGKGNTSDRAGLVEIIEAGAVGLKLHEDWGTTPAAIDNCLSIADEEDIQVTIHTDTLNESCCVEGSIAAFKHRTIHTYHSEGAGGGHAPDIITVCSVPNVIPSSTNPTRPLTKNTIDEHLDMLMVCHHLDAAIQEDIAFAESRIRKETIAAEDILHDIGAISIISSDSQAMGRIGEVITRTWQTADKMKQQRGQLPEDEQVDKTYASAVYVNHVEAPRTDNFRVKRYIAKYTINPCIAHGMSDVIGSVEVGKLADLVLWKPSYFGVKPEIVIKGGHIAWAQMGDANASIPTPEPVYMRPMYAARGKAASGSSIAFVSKRCFSQHIPASYGLAKVVKPVSGTRNIGKKNMKLNDALPMMSVDPETYEVSVDGKVITCEAANTLPMSQRYFMF